MMDFRLAVRALVARPAFTLVAVLTLALGIGANALVFTVFHAVLLAPLPWRNPDAVVILNEQTPQFPSISVTRFNYDDWRARAQSFEAMAAVRSTNLTLTGAGDPERVPVKMIGAGMLPLLGVNLERGRGFTEADDRAGAEPVALVSAAFAARRFADGRVLGQTLQLDNQTYTIIG